MSLSLNRDGTVLGASELEEQAKKTGMCHICGEVKTHERQKKGFLNFEMKPITVMVDGRYEVYKGYCLHPRCYTLLQAKRALGEETKSLDRRRSRHPHSPRRSSGTASRRYSAEGPTGGSGRFSTSSSKTSSTSHSRPPRKPSQLDNSVSNRTLETTSTSDDGSASSGGLGFQRARAISAKPIDSIQTVEVPHRRNNWEPETTSADRLHGSLSSLNVSEVNGDTAFSEFPEQDAGLKSEISMISDLVDEGNTECAAEALAGIMAANPMNESLQASCLTLVRQMSKKDETSKELLMDAEVSALILDAMANHGSCSTIQGRACSALWSLAIKAEHRSELTGLKSCDSILDSLENHMNEKAVATKAIGALLTLSADSDFCSQLRNLQATKLIVPAMEIHLEDVYLQRDGCILLSNVAVDTESNKVEVVTPEEIQAVVRALDSHKGDKSVILGACFALTNFARGEENLRTSDDLDRIISMLEEVSQSCQDRKAQPAIYAALDELETKRVSNQSMEDTICSDLMKVVRRDRREDTLPYIMKTMNDNEWSSKTLCTGLRCLWLLANELPTFASRAIETDMIQSVVSIMCRQHLCANIQEKGCDLMQCLARSNAEVKSSIIRAGGCRAIVRAIRDNHGKDEVQRAAFEALFVLSKEFECWFAIEQDGGIKDIKTAIESHKDSAVVQRKGKLILSNFEELSGQF